MVFCYKSPSRLTQGVAVGMSGEVGWEARGSREKELKGFS